MATATATKFTWGTGRRKTAVARVRIAEGTGQFTVNGKPADMFFIEPRDRHSIRKPLEVAEMATKLDVFVNVQGGGTTGQAGAIVQGLARALKTHFGGSPAPAAEGTDGAGQPGAAPIVKKIRDAGLLTRDARMKERKKYGRRGARRSFQFSKR
jgi:small subunit ribosomal protein S9